MYIPPRTNVCHRSRQKATFFFFVPTCLANYCDLIGVIITLVTTIYNCQRCLSVYTRKTTHSRTPSTSVLTLVWSSTRISFSGPSPTTSTASKAHCLALPTVAAPMESTSTVICNNPYLFSREINIPVSGLGAVHGSDLRCTNNLVPTIDTRTLISVIDYENIRCRTVNRFDLYFLSWGVPDVCLSSSAPASVTRAGVCTVSSEVLFPFSRRLEGIITTQVWLWLDIRNCIILPDHRIISGEDQWCPEIA